MPLVLEFGIYGVIIVVMMLVRPQGLIPSARRKAEFELEDASTTSSLYDVRGGH